MDTLPKKLVLASNNPGKLAEFQAYFDDAKLDIAILSQRDFAVADADETGLSFVENAILKARHAAKLTGLPALADDSGLSVPVLGGAPGIYSARYASYEGKDFGTNNPLNAGSPLEKDKANNLKLINDLLDHRTGAPITAYFVCVLALVSHESDPLPILAQGLWHGEILDAPRGDGGFGYDPLFWLPSLQKTSAELSTFEKNRISHRALALKSLVAKFSH